MGVLGVKLKKFVILLGLTVLTACDQGFRFTPEKNSLNREPGAEGICDVEQEAPTLTVPSIVETGTSFNLIVDVLQASWNLSGPNYVRSLLGNSHSISVQNVGSYNGVVTILDVCDRVMTLNFSFNAVAPVTLPSLAINNGDAYTTSASVNLSLAAAGASEMYLSNDPMCSTGGSWQSFTANRNWTLVDLNQNTFVYAKFRNAYGSETSCVSDFIFHDDTAPVAVFNTVPNNISRGDNLLFVFSSIENESGTRSYYCSLDSAALQDCGNSITYNALADGPHSLTLMVVDNAGNTSNTEVFHWIVDNTSPILNLLSSPNTLTNNTIASFEFSAQDPNGVEKYLCKLDTGPFSQCNSPIQYSNLSAGLHNFSVKAVDIAGNVSHAIDYTWQIDTAAPVVVIGSGPTTPTRDTNAVITFDANDNHQVASIECSIDNANYRPCTNPISYNNLSHGNHTVYIRAIDVAGNISVPVIYSWDVDIVGPVVQFISTPSDPSTDETASVEFTATDSSGIRSYHCSLNNSIFFNCSSPANFINLTEGRHIVEVYATDNLGNSSRPILYSWEVRLNEHTTEVVYSGPMKKADILFVMDNSDSMSARMRTMKTRMQGVLDLLDGVDWKIAVTTSDAEGDRFFEAGRFVPFRYSAEQENFLTKEHGNYQQAFLEEVHREERGSNYEEPIRAIRLAVDRPENQNFFREDAMLFTVIVTDQDEAGGFTIPRESRPDRLIRHIESKWPNKVYKNISLHWRASYFLCKTNGDGSSGRHVADLAVFSGGFYANVCDVRYTRQLRGWPRYFEETSTSWKLDCVPDGGVVDVSYDSVQNPNPRIVLNEDRVSLDPLPSEGTKITFNYRCSNQP